MDAPEPGQPRPPDAAGQGGAQPAEEEDLLAAMQATRGDQPEQAAATAPSEAPGGGPAGDRTAAGTPGESPKAGAGSPGRRAGSRRRVAAVAGLIGALLVAATALFAAQGFLSPAATATPISSVSAVASGTGIASATPPASIPSMSGGASAIVPATAPASPSQSLPAQTAPTAQVTFNELVLYPSLTAAKQSATFAFVSDGPGLVSASIVASAPRDASKICLSGDGGTPVCASGATPTASFYSRSIQSKWTVTVGSANEESPTVDVQITWPSNKAAVTASHVPFQGHPNRDSLRSLTATITPRAAGTVHLDASWPGSSLETTLTVWLVDKSGQHVLDQKSYPAADALPANAGFTAAAGSTYRLTLADESAASATNPDLTATLQLP